MTTHTSILPWEFPWTEEPGGLHSMGLQRVERDLATEYNSNKSLLLVPQPTCTPHSVLSDRIYFFRQDTPSFWDPYALFVGNLITIL